MNHPKALIILAPGFEEMEAVAPIDLLRRAEVEVVVAAHGDSLLVTGRNQIAVKADCLFEQVGKRLFDMLILPGGPGHAALRSDAAVLDCVSRHAEANAWISAICAAPVILKSAAILNKRKFTCHVSVEQELPGRHECAAVVVDDKLITAQGAGTATRFGLALVKALCGREKMDEIARSIAFVGFSKD